MYLNKCINILFITIALLSVCIFLSSFLFKNLKGPKGDQGYKKYVNYDITNGYIQDIGEYDNENDCVKNCNDNPKCIGYIQDDPNKSYYCWMKADGGCSYVHKDNRHPSLNLKVGQKMPNNCS